MASASAVGSGKRCSIRSSGGVPRRANAWSWVTVSLASPAARPRAASWSASAAPARRRRTKRTASRPSAGGLHREAEGHPLGGAAWPEALGLLAVRPGVQQRPLVAEPGHQRRARQRGHRLDRPQPEPGQPRPDVGVPREQAWRGRARGTARRRRAGRGPAGRPRRVRRGDRGGERRARDPRARRAGQDRGKRRRHPGDQRLLDPPQADQTVHVDRDPPEGRIGDIARRGDAGAERREPVAGALDGVPVRVRRGVEEGRLGCKPVRAPERDPPSHAERTREGIRVHHGPVRPGLSAEDDRAGRPRAGGAVG